MVDFGTDFRHYDYFYHDARDMRKIHIEIYGHEIFSITGGKDYGYWHIGLLGFWIEW